jgi:hypothetical protein
LVEDEIGVGWCSNASTEGKGMHVVQPVVVAGGVAILVWRFVVELVAKVGAEDGVVPTTPFR